MEIEIWCNSCGEIINLDDDEYIKHLKKFHPKKINHKNLRLNSQIIIKNES